jgi:hypothetical protein
MDIDLTKFSDPSEVKTVRLYFRGKYVAEIAIQPEKLSDTSVIGYSALIQKEEVWINDIRNNNFYGCVKIYP